MATRTALVPYASRLHQGCWTPSVAPSSSAEFHLSVSLSVSASVSAWAIGRNNARRSPLHTLETLENGFGKIMTAPSGASFSCRRGPSQTTQLRHLFSPQSWGHQVDPKMGPQSKPTHAHRQRRCAEATLGVAGPRAAGLRIAGLLVAGLQSSGRGPLVRSGYAAAGPPVKYDRRKAPLSHHLRAILWHVGHIGPGTFPHA